MTLNELVKLTTLWTTAQLAFYVNLHRAVIGPSATLTGRWRPDIDLRRMLTAWALHFIKMNLIQSTQTCITLFTCEQYLCSLHVLFWLAHYLLLDYIGKNSHLKRSKSPNRTATFNIMKILKQRKVWSMKYSMKYDQNYKLTVWELWHIQDFGLRGDKYIAKKWELSLLHAKSLLVLTQLAFYVNLHRTVIGPSATLTGRWRPDIDLRRMLIGYICLYQILSKYFKPLASYGVHKNLVFKLVQGR